MQYRAKKYFRINVENKAFFALFHLKKPFVSRKSRFT